MQSSNKPEVRSEEYELKEQKAGSGQHRGISVFLIILKISETGATFNEVPMTSSKSTFSRS